jgi:hypothetical protein
LINAACLAFKSFLAVGVLLLAIAGAVLLVTFLIIALHSHCGCDSCVCDEGIAECEREN